MRLEEVNKKEFIGRGVTGKCYRIDNGSILKIFHKPKGLYQLEKYHNFLKFKNESIYFPHEFIYDDDYFYGHLTKEVPGVELNKCFSSSNLEQLSKSSQTLESTILKISKGKITMYDLHQDNIKYDGNKLGVYDVDNYDINLSDNTRIERKTIHRNFSEYRIIFGDLFQDNIPNQPNTEIIYNLIRKYKFSDIKVSDMITELKEYMEKYFKQTISSVDDVKSIIGTR